MTSFSIIIIFIKCNWAVTRWQWLFYMYTKYEIFFKPWPTHPKLLSHFLYLIRVKPRNTFIITAHMPRCCSHFCCPQLLPKQRDFDLLSVFPSLAVTLEWRHSSLAVGRHIDECHTTANSIGNYWSLNVLCLTCGSANCLFVAHFPAFLPGTCPCFVSPLCDPCVSLATTEVPRLADRALHSST